MRYIVDGYNLLFRYLDLGEDIQKARDCLILDLSRRTQQAGLEVTLVFDSQYREGGETSARFEELIVVYTNEGETADEWIVQEVNESLHKTDEVVVTSDKRLARLITHQHAHTMSHREFFNYLTSRIKKILRLQKKKKALPIPKKPVEEAIIIPPKRLGDSFEYYLHMFEEKEKERKAIKPKIREETHTRPKKTEREQKTLESEMDRWKRLFENGA